MTQTIDFATLETPKTPNWCLIAPPGLCRKAKPQLDAPVFALPVSALWDRFLKAVAAEPRIRFHEQDKTGWSLDFTQTSLLFRFPDRVSVKLIQVDAARSTLAIYSRSKFGRSDLGVNAKRVKRLLAALERAG